MLVCWLAISRKVLDMRAGGNNYLLDKQSIRRRFDRAAAGFDDADFVHAVTRAGLLDRLAPLVIDARTIVDVGCATGRGAEALSKRFRRANVIAIDLSPKMLQRCKQKRRWRSRISPVRADARALPLADQGSDLVFANMVLPWVDDLAAVCGEVSRVLQKGGVFAFATLGPDSLGELRAAWQRVDDHQHVNRFLDMHDIGDALVNSGLSDPVLDVDRLTVTFDEPAALFRDLTAAGARNCLDSRARGLLGRGRFEALNRALRTQAADGPLSVELELVYGHCWGRGGPPGPTDVRIDAESIPLRRP